MTGNFLEAEQLGRHHAAVAGDPAALLVDQDRDRPAPMADRRRDLVDLVSAMRPRVAA
jgi:hypothetical protein